MRAIVSSPRWPTRSWSSRRGAQRFAQHRRSLPRASAERSGRTRPGSSAASAGCHRILRDYGGVCRDLRGGCPRDARQGCAGAERLTDRTDDTTRVCDALSRGRLVRRRRSHAGAACLSRRPKPSSGSPNSRGEPVAMTTVSGWRCIRDQSDGGMHGRRASSRSVGDQRALWVNAPVGGRGGLPRPSRRRASAVRRNGARISVRSRRPRLGSGRSPPR